MAKALIVSAGNNANEYLARHIGELGYTRPTIVASGGEARRRMDTNDFEVVIINTPLPDEFGHELGTDAVEKTDAGVILLAKTGTAEQIADKLQDFGVLVLAKPFTGAQFRQAVQIAASSYKRLAVLRTENAKLLDKIAQLRLVDRAKCYLIEKKGYTETDAHRLIEKRAMDTRMSRGEVAQEILEERGGISKVAFPRGGRWPRPRPRPDEGRVCRILPVNGVQWQILPSSAACGRQLQSPR